MVFSSLPFLFVYLPLTLAVYYAVPMAWRNLVLFLVSLVFYGWGEPVYILLMLFSITLNYGAGLLVEKYRSQDRKARRIIFWSCAVNLALLVFFKYYDFLAASFTGLTGIRLPILGLGLPIGISFYTFQAMSYPIDVYRSDADVQRSYVRFGAFVTLFPQLIAGPIIRYKDVADQLNARTHSWEKFASGAEKFTIGLCKKVLLANSIGGLWDSAFATPAQELSVLGAILGVAAFTFQIYFDFSGYSDMAVGLGRMLGFEFLENFNYPYIAKSITDFWRRWHISLSTWFRDYVYIPLGGNRRGLPRQILNILIVWALTGLWHGANWTFLLWGLYYAMFLILEKVFLLKKLEKMPVLAHIYALLVAVVGWMLFQLNSVGEVVHYWGAMFGASGAAATTADAFYARSYAVILFIAAIAATPVPKKLFQRIPQRVQNILTPVLVALCLVISTAYLVDATYNPFLYFRF